MERMIEITVSALDSPPELATRFAHVHAVPFGDPRLAFEVLLPDGTRAETELEPHPTEPHEPLRIASFVLPTDGARFDVALYRPGCELSLVDFLQYLCDRLGLVIESAQPVAYGEREGIDALVRIGEGERATLVRMCMFRHGDAIARLGARAPLPAWNRVADDLAVSLSTCRFLEPNASPFLEPFAYRRASGTLPLGALFPERWRAREPGGLGWGRLALELRWIERNDTRALVRLDAIERSALEDARLPAVARLGEQTLWEAGMSAPVLTAHAPSRLLTGPKEAHAESFELHARAFGAEAYALLSAIERGDTVYSVASLGPAKTHDPIGWMALRRVHEIAVLSLNDPQARFSLDPEGEAKPDARAPAATNRSEPAPPPPATDPAALAEVLGLDPEAARAEIASFVRSIEPELDERLLAELERALEEEPPA